MLGCKARHATRAHGSIVVVVHGRPPRQERATHHTGSGVFSERAALDDKMRALATDESEQPVPRMISHFTDLLYNGEATMEANLHGYQPAFCERASLSCPCCAQFVLQRCEAFYFECTAPTWEVSASRPATSPASKFFSMFIIRVEL